MHMRYRYVYMYDISMSSQGVKLHARLVLLQDWAGVDIVKDHCCRHTSQLPAMTADLGCVW